MSLLDQLAHLLHHQQPQQQQAHQQPPQQTQAGINTATQFGGTTPYNSPFPHFENDNYGPQRTPDRNMYMRPGGLLAPQPQHSPIPSFVGDSYATNPFQPAFVGPNAIDPMIFGYPPDNSARR